MKGFGAAALNYVGVPFKHRGRTAAGMDCVGLIIRAAMDCGYEGYEEFPYGREPRNSILEGVLEKHFGSRMARQPMENDVVLMKLKYSSEPSHVGIIIMHPEGGLGMVHAYGEIGRVVLQRLTPDMIKRIVGVYSWQEKY